MIRENEVFSAGRFGKPHGLSGELVLHSDSIAWEKSDCEYLVCDIDGILVPFYIEEYTLCNSDSLFVKLEEANSEQEARYFTGRAAYLPNRCLSEEEQMQQADFLVGFEAEESKLGPIGRIVAIDDSTANTLFVVEHKGKELLIPAADEFIADIDPRKRRIRFNLPQGLIDL